MEKQSMSVFPSRVETSAAPVRKKVAEMLRNAIVSGQLPGGRRLIERDLCEALGVSRPSVREALRELEMEGFVESIPNRGPVVTEITALPSCAVCATTHSSPTRSAAPRETASCGAPYA